jgi:hypothetical protein
LQDIKDHPFFKDVDWEKLARRECLPPAPAYLSEMAMKIIVN